MKDLDFDLIEFLNHIRENWTVEAIARFVGTLDEMLYSRRVADLVAPAKKRGRPRGSKNAPKDTESPK